jgi:hypothetical protein
MGGHLQCELFVTTARTTSVSVKVDSPKCSSPRISSSFSITAGQVKQLLFDYRIRMIGSTKSSKGRYLHLRNIILYISYLLLVLFSPFVLPLIYPPIHVYLYFTNKCSLFHAILSSDSLLSLYLSLHSPMSRICMKPTV